MTNQTRATYGLRALLRGNADAHGNFRAGDLQTVAVDTLTNIMHCCDAMLLDFEAALKTARMHFEAEGGKYNDL